MICEYGINLRKIQGQYTTLCLYPGGVWGICLWKTHTVKLISGAPLIAMDTSVFSHLSLKAAFEGLPALYPNLQRASWDSRSSMRKCYHLCFSLLILHFCNCFRLNKWWFLSFSDYSICAGFYLGPHGRPVSFTVQSDHQQTLEKISEHAQATKLDMHCLSHLSYFYEPEQSNSLATIFLTQWGHTNQNESYITLHRQDTPQFGKTERKMPKEIDSVSRELKHWRWLAYTRW